MSSDPKPHEFNAAFAAIRSALPSTVKAVNFYSRLLPGNPAGREVLMAFHTDYEAAEAALNHAQASGGFEGACTFARGLMSPPSAWIVADAWGE